MPPIQENETPVRGLFFMAAFSRSGLCYNFCSAVTASKVARSSTKGVSAVLASGSTITLALPPSPPFSTLAASAALKTCRGFCAHCCICNAMAYRLSDQPKKNASMAQGSVDVQAEAGGEAGVGSEVAGKGESASAPLATYCHCGFL